MSLEEDPEDQGTPAKRDETGGKPKWWKFSDPQNLDFNEDWTAKDAFLRYDTLGGVGAAAGLAVLGASLTLANASHGFREAVLVIVGVVAALCAVSSLFGLLVDEPRSDLIQARQVVEKKGTLVIYALAVLILVALIGGFVAYIK